MLASQFQSLHGQAWTVRVLEAIVEELRQPSIELAIALPQEALRPGFDWLLERHRQSPD